MPFYRFGAPGEDTVVHVRMARKATPYNCKAPKFPEDKPGQADLYLCGRMATVLCDGPGCDIPICDLHRTKHPTKRNVDYCPAHAALATVQLRLRES